MQTPGKQRNTLSRPELQEQYDLLRIVYIQLLNEKEVLQEWGKPQLEALYRTHFGCLQIEKLQLQLYIKTLKSKIELVDAGINQNKFVDINEIEINVAAQLAEAELRIMNEVYELEHARDLLSNLDSPECSAELRELYKQLAKQLHPDVNDNLTEDQKNLWYLVKDGYEAGDLKKLKAMQVVYEKELTAAENKIDELTFEEISLKVEVLKEGIKVLNGQILKIRSGFPFTLEAKIKDEDWISKQTGELKNEIEKLHQHEGELTLQYHEIINLL